VDANSTTNSRSGTISIQGQIVQINQNPKYQALKGAYFGLFAPQDGVEQGNSGMLTLNTTTSGKFSGKIAFGASKLSLTGTFDFDGHALISIKRTTMPALQLELQMDPNDPDRVSGTITDTSWVAQLEGNRNVYLVGSESAPQVGKYTVAISGDPANATEPGGDSVGTMTVDLHGKIKFSGTMADGTKITQSAAISKDGRWPLFVPLYKGQGSMWSWVTFFDMPYDDLGGDFDWYKPQAPLATYYPDGFDMKTSVHGSKFIAPALGTRVLDIDQADLTFSGGMLMDPIRDSVELGTNNKLSNLSSNKLSAAVVPKTGVVKGKFANPANGKSVNYNGVVLQKRNTATGYFLGDQKSGLMNLSNNGGPL
jgi:hypothetical protein